MFYVILINVTSANMTFFFCIEEIRQRVITHNICPFFNLKESTYKVLNFAIAHIYSGIGPVRLQFLNILHIELNAYNTSELGWQFL